MRHLFMLFVHGLAQLPGSLAGRHPSVVAESVLLKLQLLILNHPISERRILGLDRFVAGICTLFMRPARLIRSAIVLKPSTLLNLHQALRNRKYHILFSSKRRNKPVQRDPPKQTIHAIVATKERNPSWGCPRIAQQFLSFWHLH